MTRTLSSTATSWLGRRPALWFGLLGGAVAWVAHFMLAYAVAEFGCVGLDNPETLAGLTPVAWGVLGVTVLTILPAAAATLVALGVLKHPDRSGGSADVDRYMAKSGAIASGVFLFIILVETIPIFYYLRHC